MDAVDRSNLHIQMLGICFVEPQYRRQGASRRLVQWSTDKADEIGLEAFVKSINDGKHFHAKHGFDYINELILDPKYVETRWWQFRQRSDRSTLDQVILTKLRRRN